ncbi:MAG: PQQ-dependent sugar dehydrogenase [Balneolaceae bacterium]
MKQALLLTILFAGFAACSMPRGPVPLSGDAPEAKGWELETVLDSLNYPWSMVWLHESSDTLLISEKPGRLRVAVDGELQPRVVSGLPELYVSGQGGLLDLSLHPDFEENRLLYFTYSTGDEDANRTTVGRGELHGYTLQNTEEIFRVDSDKTDDQHFGSRMVWLDDSTFLLSVGDGGNYIRYEGEWIREQAQNKKSHFGSILRITEQGDAPDDNPFADDTESAPELWTYGHRNVQGLAYDGATGRVWANEHGSRGGDELNLLEPGGNYGWPRATYSREYHYTRISDETSLPGMVDPKIVWTPTQAPSGLAIYSGDKFPEWQGDLFSGSLVGEQVRRINLDGEDVAGEESIPVGRRVRDVKQGPDGNLYLLTDHENGELMRIVPGADVQ